MSNELTHWKYRNPIFKNEDFKLFSPKAPNDCDEESFVEKYAKEYFTMYKEKVHALIETPEPEPSMNI